MKKLLVCVVGLCSAVLTFGQRTLDDSGGEPSFFDRVYFGGGLGFNSGVDVNGNRYTYVGLYPVVGYMVNNKFSVGSFINYQHYSYPDVPANLNQYGISPFARYNLGQVFLYSEYMILSSPSYGSNASRQIYNRWLNGIGYSMPLGKRGALNAMALYDVIYNNTERVFASPWVFRVFFSF